MTVDDLLENVIKGLERCTGEVDCDRETHHNYCPYWNNGCFEHLIRDALSLLKAQGDVIDALLKVGYPHNFQREPRWIANYMYAITDVIKKVVNLRNEVPTIPEEKV